MIKNIVKDELFLQIPSIDLEKEDMHILDDLEDTLRFHLSHCVGMAANMIGYSKNAIIFVDDNEKLQIMVHPILLDKKGEYKVKEGCLSLSGQRECVRYEKIKVQYLTKDMKMRVKTYTGFTAEIIQHEMDHLKGILI